MKPTFRCLYAIFLIVLVFNQDSFINAYSLNSEKAAFIRKQRSLILEAKDDDVPKKNHIHPQNHDDHKESRNSTLKVKDHEHSRFLKKTHREKNKLFFLIFAIIMITIMIVAVVAKKVIEHYIDKEMKFLSDEVNKQKIEVMNKRLDENKDFIDFCLSYQKVARMYKSYAIMAQISKSEFHDTIKELQKEQKTASDQDKVFYTSLSKIKSKDIDSFYKNTTEDLNIALNKHCFNAYQKRAAFVGVSLGDGYKGFSEDEFQTMDDAFAANKQAMSEYAGENAIDYVAFAGQQVNENKYGTDQFQAIQSMKTPNKPSTTFKVYSMNPEKLDRAGKNVARAGVVSAGVNIAAKIKELTDLMAKPNADDQFLRVFKYVMIGMEILDNLIQGAASVMTLVKNANVDFPFVTVLVALGKFVEGIYNFVRAKEVADEKGTPDYELEKDLKFWDAFDSGFSLIQSIVDCVLKLVTLTSAGIASGVTNAISLGVKALVSVSSLFFAGMKLRKVRELKDRLVDYMTKKTAEFKDEVERNRNAYIKEKCSQFSTLLHNMVQNELADLEKNMMKSSASLKNVTKDLSATEKTQLEADVVKFNKGMLTLICNEDNEFCPEFIDSLEIDRSFINNDTEIQSMLRRIGGMDTFAPINSMMAVYKGMRKTETEVNYTLFLTTRLLGSDYDIVVQTPRFDIYACRGCGDQRLKLSGFETYRAGSSIAEIRGSLHEDHSDFEEVQDTVQLVNTQKKSEEEITEYLVAGFSSNETFLPEKYTEIMINFFDEDESNPYKYTIEYWEQNSIFSLSEASKKEVKYALLITWDLEYITRAFDSISRTKMDSNVLSSMVHQDSAGKKTYVYLWAVPDGFLYYDDFCPWNLPEICKVEILNALEGSQIRKFNVIVTGTGEYPGINQDLMEKYGWRFEQKIETKFKEENQKREELEFSIFSKRVIQFKDFPKVESNLDILTDLERMKGSKMGDIFNYLHSVACGEECKKAHLVMPNISTFFYYCIL